MVAACSVHRLTLDCLLNWLFLGLPSKQGDAQPVVLNPNNHCF